MRLGLLGGTYDPPHYGHLAAAEEVRHRLRLDRVLWVPAGTPPHKAAATVTPSADRLEMVRRAVRCNEHFEVSDLEVRRPGPSYTVDMLDHAAAMYPAHELILLIGADQFAALPTWHRAYRIPELARLAVMCRSRAPFDPAAVEEAIPQVRGRYELVDVPDLPLSSSALRQRVREGLPIRYLVPDAVRAYIEREGLYRG